MKHRRFDLGRLAVDGLDLPLAYGDVLVVHKDGTGPEWELQAVFLGDHVLDPVPVGIEASLLDGRRVTGNAFLVRTRERMAVFRGIGDLDGVAADELH